MNAGLTELLWPLVETARWFSGKSRGGAPVEQVSLDWYPTTGGTKVRSELLAVDYPNGEREWYHVPIAYLSDEREGYLGVTSEGLAHEATAVPEALAVIFDAIATGARTRSYDCHDTGASELPAGLSTRRFGGEQSNTSVFFGDVAMLKLFRKLEPGRNLDIELHDALAGHESIASLYGWISTGEADLAMLVQALPQPTDGYELATARVGTDFTAEAAALGVALADVHKGLREALGEGVISGEDLAATFISRAEAVASDTPALAAVLPAVVQVFGQLANQDFITQRVHGDFHLGQTLSTPAGWRIVDFEGEPMKSMQERRAPDSAWRDVAGLLRSIDYAAATRPESDTTDWRSQTRCAFLEAYCEAMDVEPSPVLAAYELDKAIYEVRYETRNRPQLVWVPLTFIQQTIKES